MTTAERRWIRLTLTAALPQACEAMSNRPAWEWAATVDRAPRCAAIHRLRRAHSPPDG